MGTAFAQIVFVVGTVAALLHGGHSKIIKPASSGELQNALDQAASGDTIQMLPMIYVGEFVIATNGPITLVGDGNTTIESESIGMHLKGADWTLKSFSIKGPAQGILVEGTKNSLEGIVLQKCGKAMVVKGEENTIKSCVVSEADYGIILDGSKNSLYYNSINIQNPALVIPPESCCGLLEGNVANGEIKLDGNGYMLNNNVANHGLYVKGCNNEFMGNVANGASFPKDCAAIDKGLNVYRGLGPNDSDIPNPNQPQQFDQGGYQQQQYQGNFNQPQQYQGPFSQPGQQQPQGSYNQQQHQQQPQASYNQPQSQQPQANYNQPQGSYNQQHQPQQQPQQQQQQHQQQQQQHQPQQQNQPQQQQSQQQPQQQPQHAGNSGSTYSVGYEAAAIHSGSSGQKDVPVQWMGNGPSPKCTCTCTN